MWIDELPCRLCANQTSSSQATGEMPFFVVHGAEAIIPLEVTMVSPHPPVCRHTMKPRRTSSDLMMSTLLMKEEGNQLNEMHGTAGCYDPTTSGLCIVCSSRWMIWCSCAYFLVKACTSSPSTGRVLSG
jgi:hypothetical protein